MAAKILRRGLQVVASNSQRTDRVTNLLMRPLASSGSRSRRLRPRSWHRCGHRKGESKRKNQSAGRHYANEILLHQNSSVSEFQFRIHTPGSLGWITPQEATDSVAPVQAPLQRPLELLIIGMARRLSKGHLE